MNSFIEFLDDSLIEINKSINEKIVDINYLEKIKFQLIEKIISLNNNFIEEFKSEILSQDILLKKHDFSNRSINYNINYFKEAVSKIKHINEKETLIIVLEGAKTISIFDKNKENQSFEMTITKNMGIVISQNTLISENTNKKSIILTIIYD